MRPGSLSELLGCPVPPLSELARELYYYRDARHNRSLSDIATDLEALLVERLREARGQDHMSLPAPGGEFRLRGE